MMEWPIIAPILTVLFGVFVLLLNRVLGNEKEYSLQWKIGLFILVAAIFQVALLGRQSWGASATGLFRLDGITTHLAMAVLVFSLFSHIILRFEGVSYSPEISVLEMASIGLRLVLVLANHLVLYAIAVPFLFLIAAVAPRLNRDSRKTEGDFVVAITGAVLFLFVFVVSAGLIGQDIQSMQLNSVIEYISKSSAHLNRFYIGWTLHLLALAALLLAPPAGALLTQYKASKSWALTVAFRAPLPLLSGLLITKWYYLTAGAFDGETFKLIFNLPVDQIVGVAAVVGALGLTVFIWLNSGVLLFAQALTTFPITLSLYALSLGTKEGFLLGNAALYCSAAASSLFFYALSELNIDTNAELGDLRIALQRSPVRTQLMFLLAGVSSAAPLTHLGGDFMRLLFVRAFGADVLAATLAVAVLSILGIITVAIYARMAELFAGDAERNHSWDFPGISRKLWAYALGAFVIVLGIYPTPLYKYLIHTLNVFTKTS